MAFSYGQALADLRMTDIITKLDAQSGFAVLDIGTTAFGTILVSITLQKPSFSEASETITMLGVPLSGVAGNTGTAAVARLKDSAGTVWVNNLVVGTSAADLILNSLSITSGQTVTITAGTITGTA
jgi:hypothetical protein